MHRYSGITVSELLKLESMKGAKVLAGKSGLNRRITKLNVMEVPDIINWVEEGEFLLTTAYTMRDNIDELESLIDQLNQQGLAGLGIKTKRYIEEIPKESLYKAEFLEFPLIEIPYEISYSDILIEGLGEIINAHANILSKIDIIQTKLINVMLSGGSFKEIGHAIYESLDKNSIAIKDYMFEETIILCSNENKKYIETIVEMENSKRKDFKRNYNKNLCIEDIDLLDHKKVKRTSIPICFGDMEYGCIFIWEDKKLLTPLELTVIEAATPIIALDIYKKISIFESESKQKIEFLEDLFSGKENRFNKAIERAGYFDFNTNYTYSVINIVIREQGENESYDFNSSNLVQKTKVKLLNIVQRISKSDGLNIISANKGNNLIILYGSPSGKSESKIKQDIKFFCQKILNYADYEYLGENIYIGIGRNYEDAREIWKSYREANRAVEYQRKASNKKIIYYEDLGIYRILSFEGLESELDQFYKDSLESLVKYDMEKGTDLILTLREYFQCEGNLKEVSEKLYIHYNTAVYRLQRIKEITGVNFEDYDDRLNLQIALKVHEICKT